MNLTNAFGTITAALTAVAAFLTALGCTPSPGELSFKATCAIEFLPTQWVSYIAVLAGGVFALSALVGKFTRPGSKLASLFGSTAVVVPEGQGKPGVVTPSQVASPK